MNDEIKMQQVSSALKISRNDPAKFMELVTCICDMEREGIPAVHKKIIRRLWPLEWQDADDKVAFEKTKWNLLRKRRLEINKRMLDNDLCFSFYILLTTKKEFKTVWDAENIYSNRLQELEQALLKKGTPGEKKKIEAVIRQLNKKFAARETFQPPPEPDSPEAVRNQEAPRGDRESDAPGVFKRKKSILFTFVLFFMLAGMGYLYSAFPGPPSDVQANATNTPTDEPEKNSIAVLLFESGDSPPELAGIADKITEKIVVALSRFPELRVAARESAFAYPGPDDGATAAESNARYILKGGTQMAGDHVRVHAQLVDTAADYLLWSDQWKIPFQDIADMENDIVLEILTAVHMKIGDRKNAALFAGGTKNIEAFTKLMEAYGHYFKGTLIDSFLARKLSQEAIVMDSRYANAYALLADTYMREMDACNRGKIDAGNMPGLLDSACQAADRAISLDDSSPVVQNTLSRIFWYQGEHDKALAAAEKAVTIGPDFPGIMNWHGMVLTWMGHYDRAIESFNHSLHLNTQNRGEMAVPSLFFGYIFEMREQYDRAVAYFETELQLKPGNTTAAVHLTACYVALGRIESAKACAQRVLELDPDWRVETFFTQSVRYLRMKPADTETFSGWLHAAGLS